MYYLLYILFLLSLLKLPEELTFYLALVLITFSLTSLLFYKRPNYLSLRTIEGIRNLLSIFLVFSALFLILRREVIIFFISFLGFIPYLYLEIIKRTSKQEPKEEKRRALRTSLCFDIELHSLTDASCYKGITRDISTSGLRVFTNQSLGNNKEFYFRVYFPEETWPITGKVKVVWQKPVLDGFEHGFIFIEISDEDRGKIALKQGFSISK